MNNKKKMIKKLFSNYCDRVVHSVYDKHSASNFGYEQDPDNYITYLLSDLRIKLLEILQYESKIKSVAKRGSTRRS